MFSFTFLNSPLSDHPTQDYMAYNTIWGRKISRKKMALKH